MTTAIKDRVTLKLYGDQALQSKLLKVLEEAGLTVKGKVNSGTSYTTKEDKKGWCCTINVYQPE